MQFGFRTLAVFIAITSVYMLLLASVPPSYLGMRLFPVPAISFYAEVILLVLVVATGFWLARTALIMDLRDDWRRGLIKI